jgi:hypothetical protein
MGTYLNREDHARRSAALKRRVAAAKAHAAEEKRWREHVTAAAAGTLWRVTASWVQQTDGTCCAELTVRHLRVLGPASVEACRERILGIV